MNAIELNGVSYKYPERKEYVLRNLNFTVEEGQFVLVSGPSGCGKSTLCRLLLGLIPHYCGGSMSGSVRVDGLDTEEHGVAELASHVGLVFQNPEEQIIMSTVEAELAFGLENMRLNREEISRRIAWTAERFGIVGLLERSTAEISGGERQRVVLASILAMKPRILVLDEPTSQLDPVGRSELYKMLKSLNDEGLTIVLVEHNVREAAPYVDFRFDLKMMRRESVEFETRGVRIQRKTQRGDVVLDVENLVGGYPKRRVLDGVSLRLRASECLALLGANGSGKTTLVKHFNGLLKPESGSIKVCGLDVRSTPVEVLARCVSYLPQNPQDMLFCDTAEDELRLTLKHLGIVGDVEKTLDRFGLLEHRNSYPRDLSVGERQRLALAAVMVSKPRLLLLDEPTRGMDERARATLQEDVTRMLGEGVAVVLVTQDGDLARDVATEKVTLREGRFES